MAKYSQKLFALAILGFVAAVDSSAVAKLKANSADSNYLEDGRLSVPEIIEKYKYQGEIHTVITDDGYILEMHRITGRKGNSSTEGKQPVLMIHPYMSCSVDWVVSGPGRAFGYLLADEGYDVWLGNVRGNVYSRKHRKYTTLDKAYWQFSWHEIGVYDLPAMIDYILEKTSKKQLLYVGHSQGTTVFWVMASERPEYQDKVKAMFALAPVAFLSHTKSLMFQFLAPFSHNFDTITSLLGFYEFKPSSDFLKEITAIACKDEAWTQPMCTSVIFLISGIGSNQFNTTMLPVILGHLPSGSSTKQLVHFLQGIKSGKFRLYDHGLIENMKRYKRFSPPSYNLAKIKVPVSLHYGQSDVLSVPRDVKRLHKELGNPIALVKVPNDRFTHLDFLWANDGKKLVYDKVMSLMTRYRD